MQRSTSSLSSILISAGLCVSLALGCAAGGSTGGSAGGKSGTGGGSNPGSGGGSNPGTGGNGNPGTGGNGNPGTGGNGNPGTGGTGNPGTGGTGNPGTGGTGNPGTGGTGNPGTGGVGGASTRPAACTPASVDVISDFEEGNGSLIRQGTPVRTGWWYTYFPNPTMANPPVLPPGATQTPPSSTGPIAVAVDPTATVPACNKALHVTGSGLGTAPNNFSGFGAGFLPMPAPSQVKTAYDLSAYTGISFKIKSGAGTPPAIYFEVLTKETQPATSGGTATIPTIDLFNTRGQLLNSPWIASPISTTWQTVTVPFGTLVPRWMPAGFGGGAMSCPAGAAVRCQAPRFNPASVIAIQFSMYSDPGFPLSGTAGTYDLWVDDITLVKADAGLQVRAGFPTAGTGSVGANCTKPAGADAKFLVPAYNFWKRTFAPNGTTVIRPENGNDTVSEGIAYAMLMSVDMNDQPFFDAMYSYWKGHKGAGTSTAGLMTWCIPGGANSCPNTGGSATDSDEDAAFALIQAGKLWGGTYAADARGLITDIWTLDIDHASFLPKGGSNYASTAGGNVTNPSYFAPSLYRAFMAAGDTNPWASVISAVYAVIGGPLSGTNGLFPAWCSGNCTAVASNGGANDMIYQYDAHRIPWRIGLDYCASGGAVAKAYLAKTSAFFQTQGATGIARVPDLFMLNGQPGPGVAPNSSSALGTAAVGAMSDPAFKTFLDDAYQSVLDQLTRGTMAPVDTAGRTPYSYFNGSLGMLTALTMTGNFRNM